MEYIDHCMRLVVYILCLSLAGVAAAAAAPAAAAAAAAERPAAAVADRGTAERGAVQRAADDVAAAAAQGLRRSARRLHMQYLEVNDADEALVVQLELAVTMMLPMRIVKPRRMGCKG